MTRLVIANAIYFKGSWATPFNAELTQPAAFTLRDQTKIEVPLMNMNRFEEGKYTAFNADGSVFETPKRHPTVLVRYSRKGTWLDYVHRQS